MFPGSYKAVFTSDFKVFPRFDLFGAYYDLSRPHPRHCARRVGGIQTWCWTPSQRLRRSSGKGRRATASCSTQKLGILKPTIYGESCFFWWFIAKRRELLRLSWLLKPCGLICLCFFSSITPQKANKNITISGLWKPSVFNFEGCYVSPVSSAISPLWAKGDPGV